MQFKCSLCKVSELSLPEYMCISANSKHTSALCASGWWGLVKNHVCSFEITPVCWLGLRRSPKIWRMRVGIQICFKSHSCTNLACQFSKLFLSALQYLFVTCYRASFCVSHLGLFTLDLILPAEVFSRPSHSVHRLGETAQCFGC